MEKTFYFYTRKYTIDDYGNITRDEYVETRINGDKCSNIHHASQVIRPYIDIDGYYSIGLHCAGITRTFKVHHIVYFVWIQNICYLDKSTSIGYNFSQKIFYQIDHIDGNKLNNHYSNLELVTLQQNIQRAVRNGLHNSQSLARYISVYKDNEKLATIKTLRGVVAWFNQLGLHANSGTLSKCIRENKSWKGYVMKYESNDYRTMKNQVE